MAAPNRFRPEGVLGVHCTADRHEVTFDSAVDGTTMTIGVWNLSGGELRSLNKLMGDDMSPTATITDRRMRVARRLKDVGSSWLNPNYVDNGGQPVIPDVTPKGDKEALEAFGNNGAPKVPAEVQGALDVLSSLLAPKVDEAALQVMVDRKVNEALKDLQPVQFIVNDGPTVQIDGRPHYLLEKVVRMVKAGVNPMLVGPAGSGKSTLAQQVAQALSLGYTELNCDPTMTRSSLLGFIRPLDGEYHRSEIRDAFEDGKLLLLDELDSSNPAVAKGLNGIMARGAKVGFPDGLVDRHENFVLLAAANTYGSGANRQYVGAYQLDASTLDRFVFINVDYDVALEKAIAEAIAGQAGLDWCGVVHAIRTNQRTNDLKVIVSTRMVEDGARLIASGFSQSDAFDATCGGVEALGKDTVNKLTAGVKIK